MEASLKETDADLVQDPAGKRSSSRGGGGSSAAECGDVYDGRWVPDDRYRPLYTSSSCPYVDEAFSCDANGRPDHGYARWRWRPSAAAARCVGSRIPIMRFGGAEMLEAQRGKRLVFAGDSLGRNQWESMACMLRAAVPEPDRAARVREARGRRVARGRGDYSIRFLDYNCSVEYNVKHFLVQERKAAPAPAPTGLPPRPARTVALQID